MYAADDQPSRATSPGSLRGKAGGHRVHRRPGELDHFSPGRSDRAIEELHRRALSRLPQEICSSEFGFRTPFVIRISSFVICHPPIPVALDTRTVPEWGFAWRRNGADRVWIRARGIRPGHRHHLAE